MSKEEEDTEMRNLELRKWCVERIGDLSRGSVSIYKTEDLIRYADILYDYVYDRTLPAQDKKVVLMEKK